MEKKLLWKQGFSFTTLVPYFLIAALFALPLSSTGKSITLVLSLIAILSSPIYRAYLKLVFNKAWFLSLSAFLIFIILAVLWSPADWADKLFALEKYSKLIYLPILAVGFIHPKVRKQSVLAYMMAMALTCLVGIFQFHGIVNFHIDPDFIFRNHIMTGFMVAFANYLALWEAYKNQSNKKWVYYLGLAVIYTYYIFFINMGRTGYVIEILLVGVLLMQLYKLSNFVIVALIASIILGLVYHFYPAFHDYIQLIMNQLFHYDKPDLAISSIGLRMRFHDFARGLFLQHPIVGNGTASFPYYFSVLKPVATWTHTLREPHSQYWLIAAEQGTIGLVLFAYFLFNLLKTVWTLPTTRVIGVGLFIPFLLGNLTDSLLFYSGSGYFFLLFMAICLGEQLEKELRSDKRLNKERVREELGMQLSSAPY